MTYTWIAVILVVILYTLYLIRFNKKWCLIATAQSDEEYFLIMELLHANKVKYFTKIAIDWGRPPGQTTVIDYKLVDFYVKREDKALALRAINDKNQH